MENEEKHLFDARKVIDEDKARKEQEEKEKKERELKSLQLE